MKALEEKEKTELKDMFSDKITVKDVSSSEITGVMGEYTFRIQKSYGGVVGAVGDEFNIKVEAPKMKKEQVDRLLELFRLWSG